MYRKPPMSFDVGGFFLYYVSITERNTMADQTSNAIAHVQSVNRGRQAQRKKIKTNLSVETQAKLQKNTEELGVDIVKKQINVFFNTPLDQLKNL